MVAKQLECAYFIIPWNFNQETVTTVQCKHKLEKLICIVYDLCLYVDHHFSYISFSMGFCVYVFQLLIFAF